ncbi:MAG TPA: hypothetical protein VJC07_01990 [Candidatus Nanoarchaeia archaeon]|nr:hypothetical protein [Candidatus Nanoarchaeia archaeon]
MNQAPWKGWIIDISLKDRDFLSKLKVIKSLIEENVEGDNKQVWEVYTVEIENADIANISRRLETQIKPEYYAHFTNGKELLIIFSKKSFRIRLERVGEEKPFGVNYFKATSEDKKIWQSALEYGTNEGKVDKRYIIKVE